MFELDRQGLARVPGYAEASVLYTRFPIKTRQDSLLTVVTTPAREFPVSQPCNPQSLERRVYAGPYPYIPIELHLGYSLAYGPNLLWVSNDSLPSSVHSLLVPRSCLLALSGYTS